MGESKTVKILVTGFEPFGGESRNPSAEVVAALPDTIAGAEIVKRILPVTRGESSRMVAEAVEEHRPDVVLSIGQAGGRAAVSIERVAINLEDYSIPDNGGNQPQEQPVVEGGPAAYLSRLPVKKMAEAIREAGIPGEVSLSAGAYVCNHVLYSTTHLLAEKYPHARAGFIHIPFVPEQTADKPGNVPSLSLEQSTRAVEIAVETVVKGLVG